MITKHDFPGMEEIIREFLQKYSSKSDYEIEQYMTGNIALYDNTEEGKEEFFGAAQAAGMDDDEIEDSWENELETIGNYKIDFVG